MTGALGCMSSLGILGWKHHGQGGWVWGGAGVAEGALRGSEQCLFPSWPGSVSVSFTTSSVSPG